MSTENSDWVDEIVQAEKELEPDELTDAGRDKFLDQYDSLEDVWTDVANREHKDSSFRIPVEDDDSLNCLGRTLMVSMYDELSEGESDSYVSVYFDGKWSEDGTEVMKDPHVTATVDGNEYGSLDIDKDADLPMSSLADLYKVGMAVQVFNEDEDIEGLDYETIQEWGSEIEDRYSENNENQYSDNEHASEYLRRQGLLMQQDAEEAQMKEELGGENVYIE